MSIDQTYDRDGQVIPDDYYNRDKYPEFKYRWGTQQRVAGTKLENFTVSTVWLMGIDHGYGDGDPVIFETMVFGEPYDNDLKRYSTEEDAMRGHLAAVDNLRAGRAPWTSA